MSNNIVIVAATRTPIGSFLGALKTTPAVDLGSIIVQSLLEKTHLAPEKINEVILGHVLTAGCGQNTSRQVAIKAGLPYHVPATTINKVCGSGLKAIISGVQSIRDDDVDVVIAGGMENMSRAPYVINNLRKGIKMGDFKAIDSMVHDGLWDIFNDYHMGITAENLAEKYNISREEQDEFALNSQQKAIAAIQSGKFKNEITPVSIAQRKGDSILFDTDEQPRADVSIEKLSHLKPAFKKENGTVTAGNSSTLNDGASAVMLMTEAKAKELNLPILATIKAYASAGVDPAIMGIGPVEATRKCLKRANWQLNDLDLIEANEAFSAQAIAVNKELDWDLSKVNVNGGALALGHPIGASGCRILVTLIYEMIRSDKKKGLATLCVGGGMGVAMAIERS